MQITSESYTLSLAPRNLPDRECCFSEAREEIGRSLVDFRAGDTFQAITSENWPVPGERPVPV